MRGGANLVLDPTQHTWDTFKSIIKPGDIFYWIYRGNMTIPYMQIIGPAAFGVYARAIAIEDAPRIKFLVDDRKEAITGDGGIIRINAMPTIEYGDAIPVSERILNDNSTFQKVQTPYARNIGAISALEKKEAEIKEEQKRILEEKIAARAAEIKERNFIRAAESKGYMFHKKKDLIDDAWGSTEIETLEGFLQWPVSGESGRWTDTTVVKGTLQMLDFIPRFVVDKRNIQETGLQVLYYKKVPSTPSKENEIINAKAVKGGKRHKHTHKKRKSKRKTHRSRR